MNRPRVIVSYLTALLVVVAVYAAIPFLSIPTLGQIVWTSGFAESFVNAGWPAIKAINFAFPTEAPIAFGLSGAFLQSVFIAWFKLPAWDAYACGAVVWLVLALAGCIGFARLLGVRAVQASFFSLIYLTLPIVWWHDRYSMLSFGFALLPLYLFSAFTLIYDATKPDRPLAGRLCDVLLFLVLTLVAVFMDGYTYVMFMAATGLIFVIALARGDRPRRILLAVGLLIAGAALFSYEAYTHYVRADSFAIESMDFFRGWGVDLVMLIIPSQGISWLWDTLHLCVARSSQQFFGDESVWATTFCAPLLILGAIGLYVAKRHQHALSLLSISVVGFYFALGPSLKTNSTRPEHYEVSPEKARLMPEHLAAGPTGGDLFYKHVPGIKSMRATYRWIALLLCGLFGLTILLWRELLTRRAGFWVYSLSTLLLISSLPDLPRRWRDAIGYRAQMIQMTRDLRPLNQAIGKNQRVVFYPQNNDFLVNYLAAEGGYYTYNVGGDKNNDMAKSLWPDHVQNVFTLSCDAAPEYSIAQLLWLGFTDFVVIPYFDTLWDAHRWPPDQNSILATKARYKPLIDSFSNNPDLVVKDGQLYALVSLSRSCIERSFTELPLGREIAFQCNSDDLKFLRYGWSSPQSSGTWSAGHTALILFRVRGAKGKELELTIRGSPFIDARRRGQSIQVYANQKPIGTLKYKNDKQVSKMLRIPRNLLRDEDAVLALELKIRHPKSSSEDRLDPGSCSAGLCLAGIKLNLGP
jgi:hypothetical protein